MPYTMFRCDRSLSRFLRRVLERRNIWIFNCLVVFIVCFILNQQSWICQELWPVESFFVSPLAESEKVALVRTFMAFQMAMAAANLSYFVMGGALIGSYRHHGRIPWDDDIDVIINSSERHRLRQVLTVFSPDYDVHVAGTEDGIWQWKFYSVHGRSLFYLPYRTPYLDVFFFDENATHIWNTHPFLWNECWPKHVTFPLRHRPFGELSVPTPCDPAAFLAVTVDVTQCRNRDFNHLSELPVIFGRVSIPCDQLAHVFQFVHRGPRNTLTQLVTETLMLENLTLGSIDIKDTC